MTIRSCTPDLGGEILCVSTLIGCFIGSGCQMSKLSSKQIKFAMDMRKRVESEDCRRQNIALCFSSICQFYSVSIDTKRVMGLFLLEKKVVQRIVGGKSVYLVRLQFRPKMSFWMV